MNKFVKTAAAAAMLGGLALAPTQASAVACLPVAAAAASAAPAYTVIGIAAFLTAYDFTRRTTCIGDPLGLGGPGFSTAVKPTDNVLIPQCPAYRKKRR
jgi:hypothetical protein